MVNWTVGSFEIWISNGWFHRSQNSNSVTSVVGPTFNKSCGGQFHSIFLLLALCCIWKAACDGYVLTYPRLIQFNHNITSLLWVWRAGLQMNQIFMTALKRSQAWALAWVTAFDFEHFWAPRCINGYWGNQWWGNIVFILYPIGRGVEIFLINNYSWYGN